MFKKNKKEDFLATEIEKDIKADETSTDEVTGKEETSCFLVETREKVGACFFTYQAWGG